MQHTHARILYVVGTLLLMGAVSAQTPTTTFHSPPGYEIGLRSTP